MRPAESTACLSTVTTTHSCAQRKSFQAVDWVHYILCTGEVFFAGRFPGYFYNIFMPLCRAGRLLFRPSAFSEAEITAIDNDVKYFVTN